MNSFRADLHCHSLFSDGTLSPEELIHLAISLGLKGLSITDHDTIKVYETAIPEAQKKNIPLIPGIEFSTDHRGTSVHLLGYAFNLDAPSIKNLCFKHVERRNQRIDKIFRLLKNFGIHLERTDLPPESLFPDHPIGRPHIAQAMIKKQYVNSVQEAFQTYLGENKPCFVAGASFSVEETMEAIHAANGFAVIAHPHLIKNERIIKDLLDMPFDGIEAYYGNFFAHQQKKWIKIGQKKGWILTGGSDFHGNTKPNNFLGSSWVNEETFQILKTRSDQNNPVLK